MRLFSRDDTSVEIRPINYQFGANPQAAPGTDWDANWLVIRGEVKTADGAGWSFTDPCLTTWETRELGSWLRGVANGIVAPAPDWSEGKGLLVFTEPNLALSLEQRTNGRLRIRIHLSLEALPPWVTGANKPDLFEHLLVLDISSDDLATAAEEWDNDCAPFPIR